MSKLNFLHKFIERASEVEVLLVGETIIDAFQTVSYEGQSMKSFCPVFRLSDDEVQEQEGGAAAIKNHLNSFVNKVDFVTNENREIVKTRYIDLQNQKKHIEVNKFENKEFKALDLRARESDLNIIADFGHKFCYDLQLSKPFHLMAQTNSNNFGFNRLSKWKQFDKKSVCLDLREASLQINRRISQCSDTDALEIFNYEMNTEELFITLGKSGSLFTDGKSVYRHHTFETDVVDTIGAGDTFYAFSCLCAHLELSPEEKLLIPSLAASLSTTWLCNEQSVNPENLIDHANRIL